MSGTVGSEMEASVVVQAELTARAQSPAGTGLDAGPGEDAADCYPQIAETRVLAANVSRDALFRRSLLVADLAAIVGAFVLLAEMSARSLQLTWVSVFGLLTLIVGAKIFGLYDRDEVLLHKTTLDETPKLFHVATLGALVAWLAGGFVVRGGTLTRHEALLLWVVLVLLLVLARSMARAAVLRVVPAERCLFIGDQTSAKTIRSKLVGHRGVKAEMVAHVELDDVAAWSAKTFSAQKLAEIRNLARTLDVHRAIVAPGSVDGGELLDLVRTLKAIGVRISVLPRLLEVVGSSVEFDDLHGVMVMGVRRFELTRSSAAIKRAFDLIGASLGLLAVAPLMIVIAVAIKLDGRGPLFFRQPRVGRHGKHFDMLKFRTMVPDADALKDSLRDRNEAQEGLFKIADDPRVTRVGRLLRKSALDELPQLCNIVRGEMSLVGPRPLVIDEDRRVEGWHRRRLELKPGMTGPWQILGPARVPLREMGAIDYLYVANWSLWGDVKLLLRTVPHVLGRRGL
ncbi:MAG TPA: exopolysaccharide biosynthesis polyprenyl glycosylphosphotransferase [Solirubrobacteraceae bacterium]|jgi:exopolysaccharide biosynthesis polyprenyl glycosylphosphotransferase|nr:exopolysaccharide biosynthesis polyprenyl glycosylphosphotransferase [Solirubrobacteraceae bacterium]